MKHRSILIQSLIALSPLLLVSACTSVEQRDYAPFVRDLDGKNELAISTYPAWYPRRLNRKGAVIERYETHGQVFFQVFVRSKAST